MKRKLILILLSLTLISSPVTVFAKAQTEEAAEETEPGAQAEATTAPAPVLWDMAKEDLSANVQIPTGTTKLELMYTAGTSSPKVQITEPGKTAYINTESSEGTISSLKRTVSSLEGNEALAMDVYYITNKGNDSTYTIHIAPNGQAREYLLVDAEVPDSYQMISEEYRTKGQALGMGIAEGCSYTNDTLLGENHEDKDKISSTKIASKEKEDKESYIPLFVMLGMMIAFGAGFFFFIRNKKASKHTESIIQERVHARNVKYRKKMKAHENDMLDKIIRSMDFTDEVKPHFESFGRVTGVQTGNTAPVQEKAVSNVEETPVQNKPKTTQHRKGVPSWAK